MKLYKAEAVVLKSKEMREADRVLTLLSRQHGKIRAVAHGVNKPSSRKRGAVQPFCYSSFLIYRGRELDSVNQCEGIEAFPGLRSHLDKIAYASYIAEITDAATMEGETGEGLFSLLLITLHFLSRDNSDAELLTRAFEIRLMDFSGLRPHLDDCVTCGFSTAGDPIGFSYSAGGVICRRCSESITGVRQVSPEALQVLRLLLRWDMAKLGRLKVSSLIRREIRLVMEGYISHHMEKSFAAARFVEQLHRQSFRYAYKKPPLRGK